MLQRVTVRLIHQVLEVAVEQCWDMRSRLEGLAAEIRIERELMGKEPVVGNFSSEDQHFMPSLYM